MKTSDIAPSFQEELARSAEKNARIVCGFVLAALVLGVFADAENLPPEHLFTGLLLRGTAILYWAVIFGSVFLLPAWFRGNYENLLVAGVLIIAASVVVIGARAGAKGIIYFVGLLQIEFALATFFSIPRIKFVLTVVGMNLFYPLAELTIGGGVTEHFVNVIVGLVIFGFVSILTHYIILSYKRQNFEQRQGLEKSATRIKNILESISDAFLALDAEGRLTFLNREAERFFSRDGKQSQDLIGRKIWDLYPALVNDSRFFDECNRAMAEQCPVRFEEFYPRLNGYFEVHAYPSPGGLSIAAHEITRRKQAEERLKASLEEKEVLLRHIHHGVKNNLQVISSLLNLQSQLKAGPDHHLRESQNRIKAMALVHEKLYESSDLASVNFREFVHSIAGNLFDSYGVNRDRVALELEIEDIRMDVDNAVACGMVLNELVSNSLKYAFPPGRTGRVRIAVRAEGAELCFRISDDGIGFADPGGSGDTLGLRLVRILIEKQLQGSFDFDGDRGADYAIRFRPKREDATAATPDGKLAGAK